MGIGQSIRNIGGDDMVYEYWFSKIRGISSHKKYRLREYYGDGKAIYYIEEKRQKFPDFLNDREKYILNQAKKETGFEKEYKEMEKQEIWISRKTKIYRCATLCIICKRTDAGC